MLTNKGARQGSQINCKKPSNMFHLLSKRQFYYIIGSTRHKNNMDCLFELIYLHLYSIEYIIKVIVYNMIYILCIEVKKRRFYEPPEFFAHADFNFAQCVAHVFD